MEGGLKQEALPVDERFVTANTSHQCLESRKSMAYWQNGKLFIHLSTQSAVQTVMSVVRWLSIEPENVVLISEYCGGGFGTKGTGSGTDLIPAPPSDKTAPPAPILTIRQHHPDIRAPRPPH